MSDYKAAKEAFVSDNHGHSIISINLTSLTALVSPLHYVHRDFAEHCMTRSHPICYTSSQLEDYVPLHF